MLSIFFPTFTSHPLDDKEHIKREREREVNVCEKGGGKEGDLQVITYCWIEEKNLRYGCLHCC